MNDNVVQQDDQKADSNPNLRYPFPGWIVMNIYAHQFKNKKNQKKCNDRTSKMPTIAQEVFGGSSQIQEEERCMKRIRKRVGGLGAHGAINKTPHGWSMIHHVSIESR